MLKLKSMNFEEQTFENHALQPSTEYPLEWLIGRKPTCDVVLSCPEVSRVHGRIIYTDEAYHFIDVGSTCGTLLNGEALTHDSQHQLFPGDLLQLGKTFIYIEELLAPSLLPEPEKLSSEGVIAASQPWTDPELSCRCCRIVEETPDVKTFYFTAEPAILFNYQPGQFVTLALEINGDRVLRPYSLSSSPTRPHHLSITIKRVPAPNENLPAGLVSNWLHDHLKVGDRVTLVGGPMGNFTCLPKIAPKLLFISAGSGITPMMSMSRWIQDTLTDCDVIFFHSARTLDDIVFRTELEAMATQIPNFHLAITVTQTPNHHPWMGLTGRISPAMLQLVVPDWCDRVIYVCGPDGFMEQVKSLLEDLDFPMQQYHEESFGQRTIETPVTLVDPTPVTTISSDITNPTIVFTRSQCTIDLDEDSTLLELAEQTGVTIPHACRAGACGACKVKISQGEVRYATPPNALSESDRAAGYALACVACPVESLHVDV